MMNRQILDISWQSFLRFFVVLIGVLSFWYFREILLSILTAFIFASLFENLINYLENKKVSRFLATIFIYILFITIVCLMIYFLFPIFVNSFSYFLYLAPGWVNLEFLQEILEYNRVNNANNFLNFPENYLDQAVRAFEQVFNLFSRLFGGIFSALIIFFLSFYINLEKKGIEKAIRFLLPKSYEDYGITLWNKSRRKISQWFSSQLAVSVFTGVFIYFGLLILQVDNALFLAIVAAVLNFIPYIGSLVASLPAILFGFSEGLLIGGLVIVIYILASVLESLVSPFLRGKIISLNPLLIILALLIGAKLAGTLGAIIAIPLVAVLFEFLSDWRQGKIISYLPQQQLTEDN